MEKQERYCIIYCEPLNRYFIFTLILCSLQGRQAKVWSMLKNFFKCIYKEQALEGSSWSTGRKDISAHLLSFV
jgi:hypothetical protein